MKTNDNEADKIKALAEQYGLQDDYLFQTTLTRYEFILSQLAEIEKKFADDEEVIIEHKYNKGGTSTVVNPYVKAYTQLASKANSTANALLKIIKDGKKNKKTDGENTVDEFLAGLSGD